MISDFIRYLNLNNNDDLTKANFFIFEKLLFDNLFQILVCSSSSPPPLPSPPPPPPPSQPSSLIPNSESHAIDPNVISSCSTFTLILFRTCIAMNVFFLAIPMISTSTSTTPLQFLQNSLNHSPIIPIVAEATAATASLRDKEHEIYNKIGYRKAWRKVWSMVYAVTSMAMLISLMVLAAVVAPLAMMVTAAAMRMIGEWFNEL